jgi:hypothetical protein
MARMQNLQKSVWEATAMKRHPEILELKERIRAFSKIPTYARDVTSGILLFIYRIYSFIAFYFILYNIKIALF